MEQAQAIIFARREAKFRIQQQAELQALLKRIECRRKEHIKQRNLDTKRLLQRNRNVQVLHSRDLISLPRFPLSVPLYPSIYPTIYLSIYLSINPYTFTLSQYLSLFNSFTFIQSISRSPFQSLPFPHSLIFVLLSHSLILSSGRPCWKLNKRQNVRKLFLRSKRFSTAAPC
jgi:hypothetical protein